MNRIFRAASLRACYYWRRAVRFAGWCPRCWNRCNYTRVGRALCPECGR